jgi:hypothetical protein
MLLIHFVSVAGKINFNVVANTKRLFIVIGLSNKRILSKLYFKKVLKKLSGSSSIAFVHLDLIAQRYLAQGVSDTSLKILSEGKT